MLLELLLLWLVLELLTFGVVGVADERVAAPAAIGKDERLDEVVAVDAGVVVGEKKSFVVERERGGATTTSGGRLWWRGWWSIQR
jgi:hypothetical protein